MLKLVIIGNSYAGFSLTESLSKLPHNFEITVISEEDSLPYRREFLVDYLAEEIRREEIFFCGHQFYEKNKIRLKKNSKAVRLDTKKQLVVLKDNTRINYDYLVIACGKKIQLPDIPGTAKNGVFSFFSLGDAESIKERLVISDHICIVGDANLSLPLVEAILKKGKEVLVISKNRPVDSVLAQKCTWVENSELAEIIGEGSELKAIKLSNGKAFEAGMILFSGFLQPETDFLKDTKINIFSGYIIVDGIFKTNFENIFACGSVCRKQIQEEKEKNWEEVQDEGILLAHQLVSLTERGKLVCQQIS